MLRELLMSCGYTVATGLAMMTAVMPPLDDDNRRATLNQHGFADSRFVETQRQFIERAVKRTQSYAHPQPVALEIGAAYGDLGLEIIQRGGHYLYNDMDANHEKIARGRFEARLAGLPSRFETVIGKFPVQEGSNSELERALRAIREEKRMIISDIGVFSVAMYLSGTDLQNFFAWSFRTLPPGGRLYISAISPYANVFPGFEAKVYSKRAMIPENWNPLIDPFPGWIPDVRAPEVAPFVPEGYAEKYTPFFHLLDPFVISYHGQQAGFTVVQSKYLSRNYPSRLRYTGRRLDVGELASVILEKPQEPSGAGP